MISETLTLNVCITCDGPNCQNIFHMHLEFSEEDFKSFNSEGNITNDSLEDKEDWVLVDSVSVDGEIRDCQFCGEECEDDFFDNYRG